MGTTIVLELPEKTYRRAQRLAELTEREVTEVLADALTLSLPAFDSAQKSVQPVSELSDTAVLALADSTMEPSDDLRLSELLYRQQAELLSEPEHVELARLMEVYQEGLLLKAEGLAEAVRRGLRLPLVS
ncbi:conserved protein of unknown function [Candidatus Promineifilum breve]|uniref:Uncharacterized protein n=1 Tax=Candidatus Promineifilum breve TaxID=1806508 RepID=A0A160T1H4_9CHLR|nr:hypothetical protein [Candidatus Promineifilum breve]CUS03881.2 conserved protein of unknown function [Candidatus Promineifilum breve]